MSQSQSQALRIAPPRWWYTAIAVFLLLMLPLLTACGGSGKPGGSGTGAARAEASSIAANPTVKADVNQAKLLLAKCVQESPSSPKGIEKCVTGQVPRAKRVALLKCLVTAYATDAASSGPKAALAEFKASDVAGHGAQPCIATALGLTATAAPVPGASANIPGITVTPAPSAS